MLFLFGCAVQNSAVSFDFPRSLGDEWRLTGIEQIAAEKTPPGVQQLGLIAARRGSYDGPGQLTMVVYEMSTQSAAFELGQTWRPMEGMLAFPAGTAFVLLESSTLSADELNELAELID